MSDISRTSGLPGRFLLTPQDYEIIFALKRRCAVQGLETPQTDLVRAGLRRLDELDDQALARILQALPQA